MISRQQASDAARRRPWRPLPWIARWLVACAAIVAVGVLPATAQDKAVASDATTEAIGLDRYELAAGPLKINGVENASGAAYSSATKTVFVILNDPCLIVELGPEGAQRRRISLPGFNDTEGIAHIGGNHFFVVEERRGNLCQIQIGPRTTSVPYNSAKRIYVEGDGKNLGLEGVAFDLKNKRAFLVKEKSPRKIYQVSGPAGRGGNAKFSVPFDLEKNSLGCDDVSDIYFDPKTGHLLILSDESKCVVECTVEGRQIGRLKLKDGHAGLKETLKQPEGITMDNAGNLYIVSEPNTLYVFKPKP